ncbi:MAG: DNA topoisomerase (ATP-hydrolyzing) subunit B [Planctomycetaceae bacterium]|nr:DNA topoisomerase (ATP-hydrolyzing) subunit B [Planctomycetaceae bacterium]
MADSESTPNPVAPASGGDYTGSSIKVLEGLDAVRKRPAMYIGGTNAEGLHHLVWEVVDNSIDEAMAGHCDRILITINADGSMTVLDNGRGIPVDWHKEQGMSALTVVMTVLHAGGKFDHDSYKVSAGLHGVGVSCVNALSTWLEAEVFLNGKMYFQRFERGVPVTEVEERGKTKNRGTKVTFLPDDTIFTETTEFRYEVVASRLRELAFLNKGLTIEVADNRFEDKQDTYFFRSGIKGYVESLNENKTVINPEVIYFEHQDEDKHMELEVAMQYNDGYSENTFSFVNNINTINGGTHLSGFRSALTRTLNAWAKQNNLLKDNDDSLQGEDTREGLAAVISLRIADPQFEGQTKGKLGNSDVEGMVAAVVNQYLGAYLEEKPGIAKRILQRAIDASAARKAARKARDLARRKNVLAGGGLPGKLSDCVSRDRESTELFLVEGDSAGGSAKTGRDSRTQAILPLRGKILNVEKHRIDKILSSQEVSNIITALGTGIGKDDFNIEKLRYGKIIIMSDADVDGSHIRTLILTFFFRHMPDLIENERLYIACPPLYKVQRGKNIQYVLSEDDMQGALLRLGLDNTRCEVRDNGSSRTLQGEDFRTLLSLINRVNRYTRAIQYRGMTLREYLECRKELGMFPKYRGVLKGETFWFSGDDTFTAFIKAREAQGEPVEIVEEDITVTAADIPENGMLVSEFLVAPEFEKTAQELESLGFRTDDMVYLAEPGATPRFWLVTPKDEVPCESLNGILENTREIGKRGMEVSRYKGLGEMNPEQLWSTTMDPEKRVIYKVTVDDAVRADQLFNLLMGEVVEPRRKFIERYALDAQVDV